MGDAHLLTYTNEVLDFYTEQLIQSKGDELHLAVK